MFTVHSSQFTVHSSQLEIRPFSKNTVQKNKDRLCPQKCEVQTAFLFLNKNFHKKWFTTWRKEMKKSIKNLAVLLLAGLVLGFAGCKTES